MVRDMLSTSSHSFGIDCSLQVAADLHSLGAQLQLLSGQRKRPVVIGVCGGTSTGKSTVVTQTLKDILKGDVVVLHQDNFQAIRENFRLLCPTYGLDHPEHYGIQECIRCVRTLRRSRPVGIPRYCFVRRKHIGIQRLDPAEYLVIDGLFAGYGELRIWVDWLIYVESQGFARLVRRIFRNMHERYPNLPHDGERSINTFLTKVQRAHEDHVVDQRHAASRILRNPIHFEYLIEKHGLEPVPEEKDGPDSPYWALGFSQARVGFSLSEGSNGHLFRITHDGLCYYQCYLTPKTAGLVMRNQWLRY